MHYAQLPAPAHLAAWFLRTFGRFIPGLKERGLAGLEELILALEKPLARMRLFFLKVDETDGERVEIIIG